MPKNMMIHTTRSDISPDGNWDCEKFTSVKEEIFSFLDTRHNNSNSTLVFKLCNASKPNSRTMYFNSTFTGPTRLTAIMYFNLYDLYDPQYMYDVRPISFVTELVGEKNIRANVEVHIQDCKRIFELFDKEIVMNFFKWLQQTLHISSWQRQAMLQCCMMSIKQNIKIKKPLAENKQVMKEYYSNILYTMSMQDCRPMKWKYHKHILQYSVLWDIYENDKAKYYNYGKCFKYAPSFLFV